MCTIRSGHTVRAKDHHLYKIMNQTHSVSATDTVALSDRPLSDLIELASDGVGLFELFSIKTVMDVLRYVKPITTDNNKDTASAAELDASHALSLLPGSANARFILSRLDRVLQAQTEARLSSDPSIAREVAAISDGTHSRYRQLARPDAPTARKPSFPSRQMAPCIYRLFQDVCAVKQITSATLFLTEDVGLVQVACNELIFRRTPNELSAANLHHRSVKLSMHPDYRCWDEDGNMYQLPGWPDWADAATWFENLPTESHVHVMHTSAPDEHFNLIARKSRYAESWVAFLIPMGPTPRCNLHPSYAWHWHEGNAFLGVHRDAPADLKATFRDIVAKHQLVSASASSRTGQSN